MEGKNQSNKLAPQMRALSCTGRQYWGDIRESVCGGRTDITKGGRQRDGAV